MLIHTHYCLTTCALKNSTKEMGWGSGWANVGMTRYAISGTDELQ